MLLNSSEIIKYTPVKREFPKEQIERHIKRRVLTFFNEDDCLKSIYEYLNDDLIDHVDVVCYDKNVSYSEGAKVEYNGIIYESLEDNNTYNPNNTNWKEVDKFEDQSLQELWELCLRDLLCSFILIPAITPATFQAGSSGIQTFGEDAAQNKGAGIKEMEAFIKNLHSIVDENKAIMYDYINKTDHNVFKKCKTGSCDENKSTNNGRFMLR